MLRERRERREEEFQPDELGFFYIGIIGLYMSLERDHELCYSVMMCLMKSIFSWSCYEKNTARPPSFLTSLHVL